MYPGWGYEGGAGRAIPGYYPDPSQDPYLVIFKAEALPTAKRS